jgi:hypothetical protein
VLEDPEGNVFHDPWIHACMYVCMDK